MVYNAKKIMTRIYAEIKESPYSQVTFCEKIGYSRVSLNNCRKNNTIPPLDVLCRMCELLNCEIGYLLCEYDCKTRENADIQRITHLNDTTITNLKNLRFLGQFVDYISAGLIPYSSETELSDLFGSIEKYIRTPDTESKQSAIAMYEIQDNLSKLRMNIQHQEKDIHKRLF